jgi:hypothetical protein
MAAHGDEVRGARALSDRVDLFGWGLLFLAVGAVALMPAMPDWSWLVATGLVMLGMSVVRVSLGLAIHGVTVVVGVVALAAGIFSAAGFETSVWPLALVVLGVTLMVGALSRARRPTHGTSLGRSV